MCKTNSMEEDCTYDDDDFVSCNNDSVFQTYNPSNKSKPSTFRQHQTSLMNYCETSNESIIDCIILNNSSATELKKNPILNENSLIAHERVGELFFDHK